ncbi:MAG: Protein RecA [Mycoplasmataceae bacterium]|nr:MAG: Protein RecA [Mycoplasmataceae bacterium]
MNKKSSVISQEAINKSYSEIIETISREFGDDSISTLKKVYLGKDNFLHSGSFLLDKKIGTDGYPCGKIVEIFGEESSGKTTLALHAVRECQKLGKLAVYMDLENALNVSYAKEIGVDEEKLLISSPADGENAFDIIKKLISLNVGLIVVDSVSTLIPRAELEGDAGTQSMGLHARLMSKGLRIINNELSKKETIVIFINQLRQKISTFGSFGNPETTTGGNALKFIASLRIRLKRVGKVEKNGEYIGIETQAEIIKNKLAAPYKKVRLEIMFSGGIQKEREILDLAAENGIVNKAGGWYSYKDKKLGNGKENVVKFLLENTEIFAEITDLVSKLKSD